MSEKNRSSSKTTTWCEFGLRREFLFVMTRLDTSIGTVFASRVSVRIRQNQDM